jgi:hypothetical protein
MIQTQLWSLPTHPISEGEVLFNVKLVKDNEPSVWFTVFWEEETQWVKP